MTIDTSNGNVQLFENQIFKIKEHIEQASKVHNVSPWTQQLAVISSAFQTNSNDELLQDMAIDIAKASLEELRHSMSFVYKKLSIYSAATELSEHMQKAIKKFPTLKKKILSEQGDVSDILKNFPNISTEEDLQNIWTEIDEIDISFQKHAALKEIQFEYKNTRAAIQRCAKGGLSFSEECSYVDDTFSTSQERILAIASPKSPTGMNPAKQIFIATTGTQNALARAKTDIYIKYGMRCLENKISFYFLKRFYEQGGNDDAHTLKQEIDGIKRRAEEELTWGEGGRPAKSTSSLPPGLDPPPAIAPPLLPIETIDTIAAKFIEEAKQLILHS